MDHKRAQLRNPASLLASRCGAPFLSASGSSAPGHELLRAGDSLHGIATITHCWYLTPLSALSVPVTECSGRHGSTRLLLCGPCRVYWRLVSFISQHRTAVAPEDGLDPFTFAIPGTGVDANDLVCVLCAADAFIHSLSQCHCHSFAASRENCSNTPFMLTSVVVLANCQNLHFVSWCVWGEVSDAHVIV